MKVKFGNLMEVCDDDLGLLRKNPKEFWEGIDTIGYCAFGKNLDLTEITIPGSVKVIRGGFMLCKKLEKVTILEGVKALEDSAFCECENLKEIILPNTIQTIGRMTFSGCKNLENIILPNSVKKINSEAFKDCKNLKEIVIPKDVEFLGEALFARCENLKVVFKDKDILLRAYNMNIDGVKLGWPNKKALDGFNFKCFEVNGDEVSYFCSEKNCSNEEKE